VQIKCADLYSVDEAAKLINATPTIAGDETTAPAYLDDAANAQLGALRCVWRGPDGTEISAAEDLAIQIAPDSADGYASHAAADLKPVSKSDKTFTNTAGDQSGYWCHSVDSTETYCTAQMLVGTFWATVNLSVADPSGAKPIMDSTVASRMQTVLTAVAGKLAASPKPVPQWVAPATTPPAFCGVGASTAKVRSIFAVPGYSPEPAATPYIDAGSVATIGRTQSCSWSDSHKKASTLDIELLAGGSWVYPAFHTTAYADGLVSTFSPTSVAGAMYADLGCDQGFCESSFAVGTTLVHIDFADLGTAKNKAALGQLAAAIAAA
jgi:hypothetical protein